jgi:hypothetical protein
VVGFFDQGNGPKISVKGGESLGELNDYQLLKKDRPTSRWRYLQLLLLTRIVDETKQPRFYFQDSVGLKSSHIVYIRGTRFVRLVMPLLSTLDSTNSTHSYHLQRQIHEELFSVRMMSEFSQCWLIQVMIRWDDVPVASR